MNLTKNKNKKFIIVISFLFIIFILFQYSQPLYQKTKILSTNIFTNKKIMMISDVLITVEISNTQEKRMRGLSGREYLPKKTGMLFVFDKIERHGIWMKDMNFSIDIIWINENDEIIYIIENAQPESYPDVFLPLTPSKYVLEVNAGFVKENKIKMGDKVVFY